MAFSVKTRGNFNCDKRLPRLETAIIETRAAKRLE